VKLEVGLGGNDTRAKLGLDSVPVEAVKGLVKIIVAERFPDLDE